MLEILRVCALGEWLIASEVLICHLGCVPIGDFTILVSIVELELNKNITIFSSVYWHSLQYGIVVSVKLCVGGAQIAKRGARLA